MILGYNNYMVEFGEKIKDLRLSKGLTQKQLAKELEQAQSTIFYWEQNKQEPNISSLKKLCEFFDVSADFLIGLSDI